jgi:hypothetical protein
VDKLIISYDADNLPLQTSNDGGFSKGSRFVYGPDKQRVVQRRNKPGVNEDITVYFDKFYEETIEGTTRVQRTYLAPDVVYVRGGDRNGVFYNFGDRLGSTNLVTDYKGVVQTGRDASGNANGAEARGFDAYG